jgi:UDP-N-acetylmuramoyl-tripeptide--D-alanyl-D-alanine ligase
MSAPALWTAADAARATNGESRGDFTATGVSIDSRTVVPGDLFIALAGPNFDGHAYVRDAFDRGAVGAVVAKADVDSGDRALVVVADTFAALNALGSAARDRTRAKVIGITGSVGKTGTKDLMSSALAALGSVHASIGNLNNHFGVPLTLARMPRDIDFAVIEMGMNHAGELRALTAIARPDIAVITTVEPVHLEFFDGIVAIADAKAEILEGVTDGGVAILNRDNASYRQLAAAARANGLDRVVGFGEAADCEVRLLDCEHGAAGNCVSATIDGEPLQYELAIDGRHWAINSLAVIAVVNVLGADVSLAADAMSRMAPPEGRGARYHFELMTGPVEVIDDSYNAGPVSMRAAFAVLGCAKPATGGRRIAVLGDMLELGGEGETLHAGLAPDIVDNGIDQVFTAGPLMAALFEALPATVRGQHAGSADSLIQPLIGALRAGDVVLVKGSHGSAMHRVVAALRAFADDDGADDDGDTDWPRAANGDC